MLRLLLIFAFVATQTLSALTVRDIGIYNDTNETLSPEGGAFPALVTALSSLATAKGYTWEYIDADDVNNNDLSQYYKMLWFPGGWAGGYNEYIDETGYQNIRDFISSGGSYMGMCAGSFFVCDFVYWRENFDEVDTPQNIYDYPLDLWPGIADGAILDFQPWDTVGDCFFGTRMADIRIDNTLLPEADPVVNMLYWGGPIFRPRAGDWGNTKVIARYEMDGFSADEFAAMILFPYGSGRVFLSAIHPELSIRQNPSTNECEFYYNLTSRQFLGQIMDRMLAPADSPTTGPVALGKVLRFDTVQGFRYQLESSSNGQTWNDYGDEIEANAFEYSVSIPASDAGLEFRIKRVD